MKKSSALSRGDVREESSLKQDAILQIKLEEASVNFSELKKCIADKDHLNSFLFLGRLEKDLEGIWLRLRARTPEALKHR
jgi:hypothetical protein